MKYLRRIVHTLLLLAAVNGLPQVFFWCTLTEAVPGFSWLYLPLLAVYFYVNIRPVPWRQGPTRHIYWLDSGCELLRLFAASLTVTALFQLGWLGWLLYAAREDTFLWIAAIGIFLDLLTVVLLEAEVCSSSSETALPKSSCSPWRPSASRTARQ